MTSTDSEIAQPEVQLPEPPDADGAAQRGKAVTIGAVC